MILFNEEEEINQNKYISSATLTKDAKGTNMCEFGLLKNKGIVGFTDGIKSIQSPRVMSRIIKSAYDFDC